MSDFWQQLNPPDQALGGLVNRPIYFIVHDVWMLVIGKNLIPWQSAKVLTFGAEIGLFFLFFVLSTDLTAAVILGCFVAFQPDWGDIVALANSELFALFGLVLYAIGNLGFLQNRGASSRQQSQPKNLTNYLLVAIGGIVAVASKENFCFTILFTSVCFLAFSIVVSRKFELAWAQLVPIGTAMVFCGLIIHGIRENAGQALYGQTFDLFAICTTACARFVTGGASGWVPAILFAGYSIWFLKDPNRERLSAALFELLLLGVVLLNFGFYTGVPLTGRYLFPENLVPAFAILPVLQEVRRRCTRIQKILSYCLLWVFVVPTSIAGFKANMQWATNYRDETKRFDRKLKKVVAVVSKEPGKPLLFDSYSIGDVEPLASVDIYLTSYGVQNPRFARLNYSEDQFQDPHQKFLVRYTESQIGPSATFRPFPEIGTKDFFRISFSSPKDEADVIANFYGQE